MASRDIVYVQTTTGRPGAAGSGVPAGGATGEVLAKLSAADGDADWQAQAGGGNVSNSGTPVANDFARFVGTTTIEGRSYAETRADLSLPTNIETLTLPASTTISAFGATVIDDASAAAARTTLDVDQAGADNSTDVTLAGTPDYITIAGQTITRNAIDLTTDVTGDLPVADGGTGSSTASGARTNLGVDVAGTDNSTDVTLAGTPDYITLSGQVITRNAVDLAADVTGATPIANGGTGQTAQQAAIDALTNVSAATNEYVLTKDTGTGNAIFKASAGGGSFTDFTVAGDTGTPQTIVDGNTLTVAGGTGLSSVASATDTLTVNHDAHTGDVTGSTALTIAADAVTYAKMQNVVADDVLLGNNAGAGGVVAELDATAIRTLAGVDPAGTDNSTDVTLAGTPDYITISGQVITRNAVDLTTDVTGDLPIADGGTGASTAQAAIDALSNVSAATDEFVLTKDTASGNAIFKVAPGAGGGMTSFLAAGDSGPSQTISDANTLQLTGGTGLTTVASATDTVTFNHDAHTGDVTGSTALTIAADSVTYDKMQDTTVTDVLLGRSTVGGGTVEEIACTAAGRAILDDASAAAQRTTLDVDQSGTDNSTDVTLAGTPDYITISGQVITRNAIDLTTDTTGDLAVADGGTGSSTAAGARTNLGVDAAGTDNSTDVTLAGTPDYITLSGQVITRNAVDLANDITGNLPVANLNSGTGASSSTFWRGDGTWTTPAGSGDVSKVGTPVDNQIGVWTGDGTIEGDAALTFDAATDTLAIGASGDFAFGAVVVLSDTTGTTTLQNIDAIDATTETTLEAALELDSLQGNLSVSHLNSGTAAGVTTFWRGDASWSQIDLAADVTGVLPTANIADEAVTLAKMAHITTASMLGRNTAATGDVEVLDAATARTVMGVDPAGTDNSTDVTLAGTPDYITLAGQVLTRNAIDLTTDVTGDLPVADGGTGSSTAAGARTNLGVDAAGTDNSTDVTLAGTPDYITISGQVITRNAVDLANDVTGNLPVANLNSGTGASSATFWRGDGTWVAPAGSGDVTKVGTPADSQIGVWTGDGTIEGDSALTFDTTTDTLAVAASGNFAVGAVTIIDDAAGVTTLQNIDAIDATTEATIDTALRANVMYEETYIDAGAQAPRTTNGAAPQTEEYVTNDVMADQYLFDPGATVEGIQLKWAIPDSWDLSTIKVKVHWDVVTAGSGGVTWGIAARATGDSDAIDGAFGTRVDVDDTVLTVGDSHITAATAAITVGNTPAQGDLIWFEITRQTGDANDTCAVDAKLLGIQVQWGKVISNSTAW